MINRGGIGFFEYETWLPFMKHLRILLLILALLLILPVRPAAGRAGRTTEIAIDPQDQQVQGGEAFSVMITVADVETLYGFGVWVLFDPSCLQVDESQAHPLMLGDFLEPDGFNGPQAFDNSEGWVQFDYTQVNPAEPQSGAGTLFVIHFIAREVDASTIIDIDQERSILTDRDSFQIPYTAQDGSVLISADENWVSFFLPLVVKYPEATDRK